MKKQKISLIAFLCIFVSCRLLAVNDPKYPFHPSVDLKFETSNLPIVIIDLDERMADKSADKRVSASMKIIWDRSGGINSVTDGDSYDYNGKIGIKYRGNTSYNNSDKKPFGVRLQDDAGKKKKASILGMAADDDWALLAPYNDKSMIRDVLLFELMRGTLEYVPTGKYCEVVLNGVYQGVYIMAARVRQGAGRININKPSADSGDGLTGGYHLEIDRNDDPGFFGEVRPKDLRGNDKGTRTYYQYKYPDEEDMSVAQKNYIQTLVKSMEQAIAGANFKDPDVGYRAYLDVGSITDFFIAQELSRNPDGYRLSTPLYKYPDSKDKRFKFSIWDFNISMGNADYYDGWSTEGWAYNLNKYNDNNLVPWMFKRILQDESFHDNLKEQWISYRQDRFSEQHITQLTDSLVNLLQESQVRNFSIWNRFGAYVWPNYYISTSWNDELNYLKGWLTKRIAWIDSQWAAEEVNMIANAGFEAATTRTATGTDVWIGDWSTSGSGAALSNIAANIHSGKFALSLRSSCGATQMMTELLPGKYTLRFWANTQSDPGANFYLRYHNNKSGSNPLEMTVEPNKAYHLIEIKDIEVVTGFAELGFYTEAKSGDVRLRIDDVEFVKQPEGGNDIKGINAGNKLTLIVDRQNRSLSVESNDGQSEFPVSIFDISGKCLYSGCLKSGISIYPGTVFSTKGLYIIKVGNLTEKVIF